MSQLYSNAYCLSRFVSAVQKCLGFTRSEQVQSRNNLLILSSLLKVVRNASRRETMHQSPRKTFEKLISQQRGPSTGQRDGGEARAEEQHCPPLALGASEREGSWHRRLH